MALTTEQARENGRKGGRPRGSRGKNAQDVQRFVSKVFRSLKDPQGQAISAEQLARDLMLNCKSEKVQGMVFLRLLEYRYGRPVQHVEGDLNVTNVNIVETLKSARNRWKDNK